MTSIQIIVDIEQIQGSNSIPHDIAYIVLMAYAVIIIIIIIILIVILSALHICTDMHYNVSTKVRLK